MKKKLLLLPLLLGTVHTNAQKVTVAPPTSDASRDIALLGDMNLTKIVNGWGSLKPNKSIDGNALSMNDTIYTSGVGAHATSKIIVKINGATRFVSRIGIDDEVIAEARTNPTQYGVANYRVSLKGENNDLHVVQEGTIQAGKPSFSVDVNTNGWKYLILETFAGVGDNVCDHTNWANAYFEYYARASTPPILVSEEEFSSKLACATKVYSQPNVRFMQKLRATNPKATISVEGLPTGLTYNAKRQLIEGTIAEEGTYTYNAIVNNDGELATEAITLEVSSKLQQPTPFMGWLSWNVFEEEINDEKVRQVADAFEKYKLNDAGYNYLCIDDLWHATSRNADGTPAYNTTKFPHGLKSVVDYVHSKGLKIGIYSDAAERTCAGCFGSFGYETQDATAYANWGFDLLKYDYCHAPDDAETAKVRYKTMGDALKATGRNILYYMCEWGPREPWKWGAETGATCWRVTYDSRDFWDWGAKADAGHIGAIQGFDGTKNLWAYGGVNRWNDADMMCVGLHGKGKSSSHDAATYVQLHGTQYTGMTQTEYQSQFSLWSIMASPLTLSFDIRSINDEDLALITNEEVIAVNQDRMGVQGELIQSDGTFDVLVKDMENGDMTVAVLNRSNTTKTYTLDMAKAYMYTDSTYIVRDLWQKSNIGTALGHYTMNIAPHETKLYRFSLPTTTGLKKMAASKNKLKVANNDSTIKVTLSDTKGFRKRILVSDLFGRVLTQGTTTDESLIMPFDAGHGCYVVNVVCNGKSQSLKFKR